MIATIGKTTALLKKYHLVPKRKYGQNFLINHQTAAKIVGFANLDDKTVVIEIGSGLGALSEIILEQASKLICYEIDPDLCHILTSELGSNPRLSVINEDFLKVDEADMMQLCQNSKVVFISNLPYYVTSEIIGKVLTLNLPVTCFIAMMQKEVAARIVSKKGGKDFNELSLFANYFAQTEAVYETSKNDFFPQPNIDSTVLRFTHFNYQASNRGVITIMRGLFTQRRKTIYNNLVTLLGNKDLVNTGLAALNITPNTRAEALDLVQIDAICHYFKAYL
jgi:16S rRNA (adenine1518-N6/adenine1519-N6)-dimethyltransferase